MTSRLIKGELLLLCLFTALAVLSALAVVRVAQRGGEDVGAGTVVLPPELDAEGFARAVEPWAWEFPRDHGPHEAFQTEWWYFTGNLATGDGSRFGFQFTIFRRAIATGPVESPSEWRANQVYMAHFTVSDVTGDAFLQAERFGRGAVGLAGAETLPRLRVWVGDWAVQADDGAVSTLTIRAAAEGFAIDLALTPLKPPSFHGENGLSRKGPETGNASYYYSFTRLATTGTVTINEVDYSVAGSSWMDHEFGTSALSAGAAGWDWFGLHLDDGRDLMVGQIRRQDGSVEPNFGGLLVLADGTTRYLPASAFSITPRGDWQSRESGATYPAGWELVVDLEGGPLRLSLEPLLANQEVLGSVIYWEGAVRVTGDATGMGYAELTGYAQPLKGLF